LGFKKVSRKKIKWYFLSSKTELFKNISFFPDKKETFSLEELKKDVSMDYHTIDLDILCQRLLSSIDFGLSTQYANNRLSHDGPNTLRRPNDIPEYIKFLQILLSGFSLLLLIGGIISFIGYALDSTDNVNLYIGIALIIVVFLTSCFTYFQEHQSNNIIESFKKLIPSNCKVKRDGIWTNIVAENLVCGDIVEIEKGNAIPADLRIVKCDEMKVDNSSLTGESDPQYRSIYCTNSDPLESQNLAFYGTTCVEGTGIGIVIATGDHTVIGRIAGLVSGTSYGESPISKEIHHFIRIITLMAVIIGISFLVLSLVIPQQGNQTQQQKILGAIVLMIGVIVANVPEGLLPTVTLSLTLTAKRMAKKNVLIKSLQAVETLGSTSVICSDKTGTLTQNVMTVSHVWFDGSLHKCDKFGDKSGVSDFHKDSKTFSVFSRICILCNRALFLSEEGNKEIQERKTLGDASESAILKFTEKVTARGTMEYREKHKKLFEVPFDSSKKYQFSVHQIDEDLVVVMKGAPEKILDHCTKIMINGELVPMDVSRTEEFENAYDRLGGNGERVLGLCQLVLPSDFKNFELEDMKKKIQLQEMTFVGLISMIDPPRPGVAEAVQVCKDAGIKVIMVTGDHPLTAKAIAKQVNIISHDTIEDIARRENKPITEIDAERAGAIVIHGHQIKDLDDDDWEYVLKHKDIVFARTSPQQKLQIVERNQLRGDIVAVTGDGVNDSPALKKADIGIAMGIMGSDVSRNAANMILLDDNFASIVNGIEEGRLIFDNLKKSISYTLSSNIPEIIPFLLYVTLGIPLPLSTILMLCIDLGTDMIPAISLAHEPAESKLMKRPPRNSKKDRLVDWKLLSFAYLQIGVVQALAAVVTYFYVMYQEGWTPSRLVNFVRIYSSTEILVDRFGNKTTSVMRNDSLLRAQTAYFVAIIIVQWADLIICKTRRLSLFTHGFFSNKQVIYGIIFETVLAVLLVYVPFLNPVFGTLPLKLDYVWIGIPFALIIFFYDEMRKYFIRRYKKGFWDKYTYY
jgi:sodium/potassium-transporting ATPase subunit alpha